MNQGSEGEVTVGGDAAVAQLNINAASLAAATTIGCHVPNRRGGAGVTATATDGLNQGADCESSWVVDLGDASLLAGADAAATCEAEGHRARIAPFATAAADGGQAGLFANRAPLAANALGHDRD